MKFPAKERFDRTLRPHFESATALYLQAMSSAIVLVHLSLLTMTSPNQLCDVLLFVCSKMADALNCLLQIEQERSEEESSVGDAWALAFRCARFCSASLILFASYSPAPLFVRPHHFVRSCAICSHDCWYVEVFKGGFEGVLVSLLLTTMGAVSYLKFSIEDFLWQMFIRHSGNMACPS